MICKFCGSEIKEGYTVCAACGKDQNESVEAPVTSGRKNSALGLNITALVLSLLSPLISWGLGLTPLSAIMSIVAIILACVGAKVNRKMSGLGIASLVIGILGLVYAVIITILLIISLLFAGSAILLELIALLPMLEVMTDMGAFMF